jgi:hypothetical protein
MQLQDDRLRLSPVVAGQHRRKTRAAGAYYRRERVSAVDAKARFYTSVNEALGSI